jgi:hypothetical protein
MSFILLALDLYRVCLGFVPLTGCLMIRQMDSPGNPEILQIYCRYGVEFSIGLKEPRGSRPLKLIKNESATWTLEAPAYGGLIIPAMPVWQWPT